MTTRGWPLALAAVTVVAVALAACGGDDDASSGTTVGGGGDGDTTETADATAPASSATTEPRTPEQQAIAAYDAAWEAEFAALNPPNPMHPALAQHLTGAAARDITAVIVSQQTDGQYTVGSMETHPSVVSATAEEVRLRDCTVEDSTTYVSGTDQVVDQGPYPPRRREVLVVSQDGTWRVAEITTPEGSCTPG